VQIRALKQGNQQSEKGQWKKLEFMSRTRTKGGGGGSVIRSGKTPPPLSKQLPSKSKRGSKFAFSNNDKCTLAHGLTLNLALVPRDNRNTTDPFTCLYGCCTHHQIRPQVQSVERIAGCVGE
jgi:hypothetical protein